MFTQLNPTLPLHVLGKGDGYAIGMIDYGQEHNLIWVTVLNDNGEVWCAANPNVRFGKNWSMGRAENPLVAQDKARAHPPIVVQAPAATEACACAEDA